MSVQCTIRKRKEKMKKKRETETDKYIPNGFFHRFSGVNVLLLWLLYEHNQSRISPRRTEKDKKKTNRKRERKRRSVTRLVIH